MNVGRDTKFLFGYNFKEAKLQFTHIWVITDQVFDLSRKLFIISSYTPIFTAGIKFRAVSN